MLSNLFILTAGLAALMFALLLGLFLVAAFNTLIIEPFAKRQGRKKAPRNRFNTPRPRLRRRPKQ